MNVSSTTDASVRLISYFQALGSARRKNNYIRKAGRAYEENKKKLGAFSLFPILN